jgi:hypothetical protein
LGRNKKAFFSWSAVVGSTVPRMLTVSIAARPVTMLKIVIQVYALLELSNKKLGECRRGAG